MYTGNETNIINKINLQKYEDKNLHEYAINKEISNFENIFKNNISKNDDNLDINIKNNSNIRINNTMIIENKYNIDGNRDNDINMKNNTEYIEVRENLSENMLNKTIVVDSKLKSKSFKKSTSKDNKYNKKNFKKKNESILKRENKKNEINDIVNITENRKLNGINNNNNKNESLEIMKLENNKKDLILNINNLNISDNLNGNKYLIFELYDNLMVTSNLYCPKKDIKMDKNINKIEKKRTNRRIDINKECENISIWMNIIKNIEENMIKIRKLEKNNIKNNTLDMKFIEMNKENKTTEDNFDNIKSRSLNEDNIIIEKRSDIELEKDLNILEFILNYTDLYIKNFMEKLIRMNDIIYGIYKEKCRRLLLRYTEIFLIRLPIVNKSQINNDKHFLGFPTLIFIFLTLISMKALININKKDIFKNNDFKYVDAEYMKELSSIGNKIKLFNNILLNKGSIERIVLSSDPKMICQLINNEDNNREDKIDNKNIYLIQDLTKKIDENNETLLHLSNGFTKCAESLSLKI